MQLPMIRLLTKPSLNLYSAWLGRNFGSDDHWQGTELKKTYFLPSADTDPGKVSDFQIANHLDQK